MPGPAIIAVPATAFYAYAAVAKHFIIHAATSENIYAISSASLAYILTKMAWNNIPTWIKEDVAIQNLLSKNNNDDNARKDELTNITSIIEKLQGLVVSSSKHFQTRQEQQQEQQEQSIQYMNASFLLYLQLVSQLQQRYPYDRIHQYNHLQKQSLSLSSLFFENIPSISSSNIPHQEQQLQQQQEEQQQQNSSYFDGTPYAVRQLFNFAVWAYEGDRNQLKTFLNFENNYIETKDNAAENTIDTNDYSISNDKDEHHFDVLQHQLIGVASSRPGYLGHYMAINHVNQTVIIGIKGTSSFEDIIIDCCGRAVSYDSNMDTYDAQESDVRIEIRAKQPPTILYQQKQPQQYQNDKNDINNTTTNAATTDTTDRNDVGNSSSLIDQQQQNDENDDDDEQVGIEVVSGHERIWIEHDHHTDSLFQHDDIVVDCNNDDNHHNYYHDPYNTDTDNNRYSYHDVGSTNRIRCHEGILISTRRLADKVQKNVELYIVQKKYQLIICGHSLGAGAASLLAVILRSRLPDLVPRTTTTPTPTNSSAIGQQPQSLMKVFAFAPPPVLDYDTSIAASSYTTSFVNNSDLIPRCSLANLIVFFEFLKSVSSQMEERKLTPSSVNGTLALFRKLAKGNSITDDNDLILKREEMNASIQAAMQKIPLRHPDHLYIPGRVILLYDDTIEDCCDDGDDMSTTHERQNDGAVGSDYAKPKKNLGSFDKASGSTLDQQKQKHNQQQQQQQGIDSKKQKFVITDGATSVLRFFELDSFRFITDHTTASYEVSLQALTKNI